MQRLLTALILLLSLTLGSEVARSAQGGVAGRDADLSDPAFSVHVSGASGDSVTGLPAQASHAAHRVVFTHSYARGTRVDFGPDLTIAGPPALSQGQGAGASLDVEWTSGGTKIKVHVTQGSDELPSAFANRAKRTVAEMQAAFPVDP